MSSYYMPQSTIYFNQRFSPTLVHESPKSFDAHADDHDGECDELSAKD